MIKFTKRPNIANLKRHLGDNPRAIINAIRHEYTNYDRVQHQVFASDDAEDIFRDFFRAVVALDKSLMAEAVDQYRGHVARLA